MKRDIIIIPVYMNVNVHVVKRKKEWFYTFIYYLNLCCSNTIVAYKCIPSLLTVS